MQGIQVRYFRAFVALGLQGVTGLGASLLVENTR